MVVFLSFFLILYSRCPFVAWSTPSPPTLSECVQSCRAFSFSPPTSKAQTLLALESPVQWILHPYWACTILVHHPRWLHRLALFRLQVKYCCLCAIILLLPSMYTPFFGVHSAPFPFFFHKVLTHLQMFYYLGAASFSPLPSSSFFRLLCCFFQQLPLPIDEFFLICCFLQQLPLPMSSFSLAASSALLLPVLFSALYLFFSLKPGAVMRTCHLGGEVCSGYIHYLRLNPWSLRY